MSCQPKYQVSVRVKQGAEFSENPKRQVQGDTEQGSQGRIEQLRVTFHGIPELA